MPYGTPTSSPAGATYGVGVIAPNGVQVQISIGANFTGKTEAERDAAFQAALDAVAGLTGWTFNGGYKQYGTEQEITVTP